MKQVANLFRPPGGKHSFWPLYSPLSEEFWQIKDQEVLDPLQQHNQVISSDIAEHFQVFRQQAHKLLAALVEKGFTKKTVDTKGSYYAPS